MESLLTQLLDPTLPRCTCQERIADPYDCPMHGEAMRLRRPIAYATSRLNTRLSAMRLGAKVDDTWRVSVYRDGVPETFTAHTSRLAHILAQFDRDGFMLHTHGPIVEAYISTTRKAA